MKSDSKSTATNSKKRALSKSISSATSGDISKYFIPLDANKRVKANDPGTTSAPAVNNTDHTHQQSGLKEEETPIVFRSDVKREVTDDFNVDCEIPEFKPDHTNLVTASIAVGSKSLTVASGDFDADACWKDIDKHLQLAEADKGQNRVVYNIALMHMEAIASMNQPLPNLHHLIHKLHTCGLYVEERVVSRLYETYASYIGAIRLSVDSPTTSNSEQNSTPEVAAGFSTIRKSLQLSSDDTDYWNAKQVITRSAADTVRAYWATFKHWVPLSENEPLHEFATCLMKNYINDNAWWTYIESVFIRLEVISALNNNACIAINVRSSMNLKYYIGNNCQSCPAPHKIPLSINSLSFLFMFGRPTIEQVSAILHSPLSGSHLCGTFFCRVPSHKILESHKVNNSRMGCHLKVDNGEALACKHTPQCLHTRSEPVFELKGVGLGHRDVSANLNGPVKVNKIGSNWNDAVQTEREHQLGISLGHLVVWNELSDKNAKILTRIVHRVRRMEDDLREAITNGTYKNQNFWKSQSMRIWPMTAIKPKHRPSGDWDEFASKHRLLQQPGLGKLIDDLEGWQAYMCIGEECEFKSADKADFRDHVKECPLI